MIADLNEHPRVKALIDYFRGVDAAMRDLPLYNDKVTIEAIGFRLFGEDTLLGVLLTPWFMNLILLPLELIPMDMAAVGKKERVALPAGNRVFVIGGDAAIGLYKAHSLHSPLSNFTLPSQACAEAERTLEMLMTPAEPANGARGLNRRALLMGARAAPA